MSEAEKYHARRQVNMHVAEYLLFTVTVSQPHALATSLYIVKLPSFVNSSRVQIKKTMSICLIATQPHASKNSILQGWLVMRIKH